MFLVSVISRTISCNLEKYSVSIIFSSLHEIILVCCLWIRKFPWYFKEMFLIFQHTLDSEISLIFLGNFLDISRKCFWNLWEIFWGGWGGGAPKIFLREVSSPRNIQCDFPEHFWESWRGSCINTEKNPRTIPPHRTSSHIHSAK